MNEAATKLLQEKCVSLLPPGSSVPVDQQAAIILDLLLFCLETPVIYDNLKQGALERYQAPP